MKQKIIGENGITYTLVGDHYLPDIELPDEEDDRPLGVWAQRRLNYIREHRRGLYSLLIIEGRLHSHLAEVEELAQSMFLRIVDGMAASEGIDEPLKATNQMEWVCRMNNVRHRATEIINNEVIYT